jgi:DNA topoisomerase I
MSTTSNSVSAPAKGPREIPGIFGSRKEKIPSLKRVGLVTPSGAKVPPGWRNVWVTADPGSPLQATGRDSKGRRVYLYSAEHMGTAAAAKFSRLKVFAKAYNSLMKKIRRDMNDSEDALVLYLIAKTGFRIGGKSETHAAVKAFGASTLQCSHVSVSGDELSFDFIGKKGSRVRKILNDKHLAQVVAARCGHSFDPELFGTTDRSIRAYLRSISAGSGFTVKDFRTYLATLTAFRKIKTMPVPGSRRDLKKYRKEVGQTVADELGNSATIALNSYIAPEVFCAWQSGPGSQVSPVGKKPASRWGDLFECIHYNKVPGMHQINGSS